MDKRVSKRHIIFFLLSLFMITNLFAQADDFRTWTSIKASHKLTSGFQLSGKLEFRTKDAMKSVDRWGAAFSGAYSLLPFLKAEAGYELHYRTREEDWTFQHRYNIGVTGSLDWKQFRFSLRERFQQTFLEGQAESRFRSRLKVAYQPDGWVATPYFLVELYQAIGNTDFFDVARMRYRPGVELSLSEKWSLDVFYCYQYQPDQKRHIIGVECSFDF